MAPNDLMGLFRFKGRNRLDFEMGIGMFSVSALVFSRIAEYADKSFET
jgi:hypothetical protein